MAVVSVGSSQFVAVRTRIYGRIICVDVEPSRWWVMVVLQYGAILRSLRLL